MSCAFKRNTLSKVRLPPALIALSHKFLSNSSIKTKGIMIAVRNLVAFQLSHIELDPMGRFLILDALFNKSPLVFVNIYTPNCHQKCFLKLILNKIFPYPREHLIIFGHFNDTLDQSLDTTNTHRGRTTALPSIVHLEDLFDPWQCLHDVERDYIFYSQPNNPIPGLTYS